MATHQEERTGITAGAAERTAQLSARVDALHDEQIQLRQDLGILSQKVEAGLDRISGEIAARSRAPWQNLITFGGLIVTVMTLFGTLGYMGLSGRIEVAASKNDVLIATIGVRQQEVMKDVDHHAALLANIAPRSELKEREKTIEIEINDLRKTFVDHIADDHAREIARREADRQRIRDLERLLEGHKPQ